MRHILPIVAGSLAALAAIVGVFAYVQASNERVDLVSDLQYRTRVVADSLQEAVTPAFRQKATTSVQKVIGRIASNERIAGIAVFDSEGQIVAHEKTVPNADGVASMIVTAMDSSKSSGSTVSTADGSMYLYVTPLTDADQSVIGALAVVQSSAYIDETIGQIWWRNVQRLLALAILMLGTIFGLVYWTFRRPIMRLSETLSAIRRGDVPDEDVNIDGLLAPLANEITKMTRSLHKARMSASREARLRLEKLDTPWTAERLREFVKAYLKDRSVFVVTDLEPYVHKKPKNDIIWQVPASGLITALEPMMQACGGMWIATGRTIEDKLTADEGGKLRVPPDEPKYTLKRVWLSEQERERFQRGFCSQTLWPLFHMIFERPTFRQEEWEEYRKVNSKFAKIILREVRDIDQPVILLQDFQFMLVPALIKKARPDAQIGLFWHITWPDAEMFSTCPWKKEILEGLLGADIIGFHTQQFCNNFMDVVTKEVEALADFEQFAITRGGHTSYIKPFPIGTEIDAHEPRDKRLTRNEVLKKYGIGPVEFLGFGVERMNAIKGLVERMQSIELFIDAHPEYKNRFTFLQITAPSKDVYGELVKKEIKRINDRLGTDRWKPIVHVDQQHTHEELRPVYRAADVYMVTSLHDGMNLVSKEYIASKETDTGTLILSRFAGAARELKDALIINPYDVRQTADAIYAAVSMPEEEMRRRMKRLRETVRGYSVYRWAAEFLKAVTSVG